MSHGTSPAREQLSQAIAALPRITLARLPTPLERLPRLGDHWRIGELWIKRDDLTGLAFGGNKARKLEFLCAHAQQKGARVLVTGGRTQSNHTRDTAVAARRLGMDAVVLLSGEPPEPPTANVLLTELLGVEIAWAKTDREALRHGMTTMAKLKLGGRKPYFIPAGASNPRGTTGYVNAILELVDQCDLLSAPLPDVIVAASGTGGTVAGMTAAVRLLGLPIKVIGVCAAEPPYGHADEVARLATSTCKFLGFKKETIRPEDVTCDGTFLGEGYAKATTKGEAAIRTLARHEGIFLDHVYTGKALAGLHGMLERGSISRDQRILFWHTGGGIGLFR